MNIDIGSVTGQSQMGQMSPKEVATQVQAMFMEVLIRSMEASVEAEGGLFGDSSSSEIYRGMLRQELALAMSQDLNSPLVEQLEKAMGQREDGVTGPAGDSGALAPADAVAPIKTAVPGETAVRTDSLPVKGRVSSPEGWRRDPINGEVRYHRGTDIAAPKGTPIQAVSGGLVIESGRKGGYGNAIVIEAEDGRKMLYAHNSVNHVEVGQRVRGGEVIARVGSTGRATGPHVHFEVTE